MRLSSYFSLELLYIHNGDEPSENNTHMISFIQVLNCITETTSVDRTLILKAVTYEHLLRISGI